MPGWRDHLFALHSGAPVWLKPVKFASSVAIYSLSIAWMVQLLPSLLGS